MKESALRSALCEAGRRLTALGLVGGTEGNLSARIDSKTLLCTPSGARKGELQPDQILRIDCDGNPLDGGHPSTEILLHLVAYRHRPDCQAVVHAHPCVATALTVAGGEFPDDVLPEAAVVLGPVKILPFAMPGTMEVPDGMQPFILSHKTFVLSHHGAATLGSSVGDAVDRMETLERIARVLLAARLFGGVTSLPKEAAAAFRERFLNGLL